MSAQKLTLSQVKSQTNGTAFSAFALVTKVSERLSKTGAPFWDLKLSDRTDTLTCRVWSSVGLRRCTPEKTLEKQLPAEQAAEQIRSLKGCIVWINGKIGEFNGAPQYTARALVVLSPEMPGCQPENFVPASPIPRGRMEREFWELVDSCTDEEIRKFLHFVFDKKKPLWNSFRTLCASARNHHAYAFGLLEHTLYTAKSAVAIANSYNRAEYKPDVNVVTAGALLNDIGMTECYTLIPEPDTTLDCTIFDHVAVGYAIFEKLADEFKLTPALRAHLGHIILSSHGQREFGSAVAPATPEAMIVFTADSLDSSIIMWRDDVKELVGGMDPDRSISDMNYPLKRRFWKWKETQKPVTEEKEGEEAA